MRRLRAGGTPRARLSGCPGSCPLWPARRMGEFAAREPVGPTEQPKTPTELPVLPTDQPRQASEAAGAAFGKATLHDLRLPGGQAGGHGGTRPRLLGRRHAVCSRREMWVLAAAASSTAFFLGAIGALGIPLLLLAELESLPASPRRVTFSTGMYISCLAVLSPVVGHTGPLPDPGRQPRESSAPTRRPLLSSWSDQWRQWAASLSTALQSDCTGARPNCGEAA